MATQILTNPLSDREHIERVRTFAITGTRPDFQDVVAQIVFAAYQMHGERVTGQWQINFSQGTITNTQLVEKFTKK